MIRKLIIYKYWLILTFCIGSPLKGLPQNVLSGKVHLDTTIWDSQIYLSIIPELSQLNTISYANIIERTEILPDGSFQFSTDYLSRKDELYRIHISKKGDPAASLIIGGKDHNHFFIIAKTESNIRINSLKGPNLYNELSVNGYHPSVAIQEINNIVGLLDTLDYYGSNVNRDFIRDAVNDRLLEYADTCSNDLVAAYARLRAGQDPQRVIPWSKTIVLLAITSIFILVVTMLIRRFKPTRKDPVSELTIQERKIYAFLKEGKSNKEIADECAVSVSTVKSHVNSIYSKLGVKSRKDIADF